MIQCLTASVSYKIKYKVRRLLFQFPGFSSSLQSAKYLHSSIYFCRQPAHRERERSEIIVKSVNMLSSVCVQIIVWVYEANH